MYFFDTCALLNNYQSLEKILKNKQLLISNISLIELEQIKTSKNKTPDIQYKARQVTKILQENFNNLKIITYSTKWDKYIADSFLELNNDSKILMCVTEASRYSSAVTFVTQDLSCYNLAKAYGLKCVTTIEEQEEEYTGYKIYKADNEDDVTSVYTSIQQNTFPMIENQYLIISNDNKDIDYLVYRDSNFHQVKYHTIETKRFGTIKPLDTYQILALDSLNNNQITILRGPAGSGKSYLGLGFLFSKLEKQEIDKIIIFCNTVATADSAKLGFYPGSKNSKLLDSQIGNFLSSKLGSITEVERLINEDILQLIPMSDCRGFDTSGMRAGIYCTEGQNMTVDMMKLLLQRIGEDSICVIEGDNKTQVDLNIYGGNNNGLNRAIDVFKGEKIFGTVTLPTVHRSKIAEIAERM